MTFQAEDGYEPRNAVHNESCPFQIGIFPGLSFPRDPSISPRIVGSPPAPLSERGPPRTLLLMHVLVASLMGHGVRRIEGAGCSGPVRGGQEIMKGTIFYIGNGPIAVAAFPLHKESSASET